MMGEGKRGRGVKERGNANRITIYLSCFVSLPVLIIGLACSGKNH